MILSKDLELADQLVHVSCLHLQNEVVNQVHDFLSQVNNFGCNVFPLDDLLVDILLGGDHVASDHRPVSSDPSDDPAIVVLESLGLRDVSVGGGHRVEQCLVLGVVGALVGLSQVYHVAGDVQSEG